MMENQTMRKCNVCGEYKPITEFRKDCNKATGYRNTCKSCKNEYERNRIRTLKIRCIMYKGGQCTLCGLKLNTKNLHVFEFHHINPQDKQFTISSKGYNLDDPKVRAELDICILVCANDHRYCHKYR